MGDDRSFLTRALPTNRSDALKLVDSSYLSASILSSGANGANGASYSCTTVAAADGGSSNYAPHADDATSSSQGNCAYGNTGECAKSDANHQKRRFCPCDDQVQWVFAHAGDSCTLFCGALGYDCDSIECKAFSDGGAPAVSTSALFTANAMATAGRTTTLCSNANFLCNTPGNPTCGGDKRPYRHSNGDCSASAKRRWPRYAATPNSHSV